MVNSPQVRQVHQIHCFSLHILLVLVVRLKIPFCLFISAIWFASEMKNPMQTKGERCFFCNIKSKVNHMVKRNDIWSNYSFSSEAWTDTAWWRSAERECTSLGLIWDQIFIHVSFSWDGTTTGYRCKVYDGPYAHLCWAYPLTGGCRVTLLSRYAKFHSTGAIYFTFLEGKCLATFCLGGV